ncbi:hypothetical protein DAEQUDRAFT_727959 [Daedalea quercina L-15889]|uniref:Uncharacterized protein n=1 Tax=Daedalea quercina L-15889 TaxID=1314783 RepID=A0A165PMD1_9APHY|nr:hypothetical protein DAEQUDRAFT_727959 [Daedalea quercina L-15889]
MYAARQQACDIILRIGAQSRVDLLGWPRPPSCPPRDNCRCREAATGLTSDSNAYASIIVDARSV